MKIHGCQHTEEGTKACNDCLYFGIIPKIRHITLTDKNGRKAGFANILFNCNLKFNPGSVNRELIDAFVQAGR